MGGRILIPLSWRTDCGVGVGPGAFARSFDGANRGQRCALYGMIGVGAVVFPWGVARHHVG